ncbi:2-oxoacid:acceptor oxidoreductase family protein [Geoglobus acetivorans]|nr:2-oxoacid:acceptor oxidoreductase family protein [Geoglobus acetivorans]
MQEDDEVVEGVRWEIRFHGRGGQGAVTASLLLAEAAFRCGYYSQSIPFFGAERRGAPVLAFTRISEEEILERSQIYSPDCVIVLDPVLPGTVNIFSGLKNGGIAVINTTDAPEKFRFHQNVLTICTVDAVDIAIRNHLVVSGTPVVNIPLLGAFLRIFSRIPPEITEDVIRERFRRNWKANVRAMWEGYENAVIRKVKGSGKTMSQESKCSIAVRVPVSKPVKGVAGRTSIWRDFVPEIDYSRCTGCLNCWLHCPESAVLRDGREVRIDYDFCKGCLVCSSVCPKTAISVAREVMG